ncbi:MAG: hypothetical protein PHW95_05015 [Patescibacteria group bacterium]|nr:hypothetical protein [Patescibacteria group bacterium]
MKKYFICLALGLVSMMMLSPINLLARTESTNYIIWGDVFSAGGTENSQSTNYGLSDSIGEAMILSATSTSNNYGVKAGFRELYPDNYLSLSLGSTLIELGSLTTAAAKTASHTMTVDANSPLGVTITVTGSTLTNGSDLITAIGATATTSSPGTRQFGINLVANTSPSIGANPSGTSPIGSAASQYGIANHFAFNSGDTVASAANDINPTIFTVSYLANIADGTPAGNYSTILTYAATANF